MSERINWIRAELLRHFPKLDHDGSADLDKNGRIDPNEKISTFNKNALPGNDPNMVGDWADWLAFYGANAKRLATFGGVFAWAGKFKHNNPIHLISTINSAITSRDDVITTYKKVSKVVDALRQDATLADKPPAEKMEAISKVMVSLGIIGSERKPLLDENMSATRLDPASASLVVAAVAHEMGWPVYVVNSPDYIFTRWDKNGARVNLDFDGKTYTDEQMRMKFKELRRSPELTRNGVYFHNLDLRNFVALALRYRGEAFLSRGDKVRALKDAQMARTLNPKYVRAYNLEGVVHNSMGNHDGALKSYEMVTRLNPLYEKGWYNLAITQMNRGNYKEMISYLDKTKAIDPKYITLYRTYGFAHYFRSRYDEALDYFRKELAQNPQDDISLYYMGLIHRYQGNYREAINEFNKSNAINENWERHYYLGRTHYDVKDYQKAITHFIKVSQLNPKKGAVANYNLGVIYYDQKNYTAALGYLNVAINLANNEYATCLYQRGLVRAAMRDYDGAIWDFNLAKDKDIRLIFVANREIARVNSLRKTPIK